MLTSGELTTSEIPKDIQNLAEALAKIHGSVVVLREEHGLHIRFASPICLAQEGRRELDKRHLYVNAERYFGMGQWAPRRGTYDADMSALCMKTQRPYSLTKLLSMPRLDHGICQQP